MRDVLLVVRDYNQARRLGAELRRNQWRLNGMRVVSIRGVRSGALHGHSFSAVFVDSDVDLTTADRVQVSLTLWTGRHG